jgi:phosphohistidine phosphatase
MQLYLLRHGIAEEAGQGKSDADRELTPEGRGKLRDTLRVAANAAACPSLILSSPLIRALQTAQLAARHLHYKGEILQTNTLAPNSRVERVLDEIRVHHDERELLLVGHDPLFTQLAGYLLGLPELQIDFKKGAILRIDIDSFGPKPKGVLRWFLTSKLASGQSDKNGGSRANSQANK